MKNRDKDNKKILLTKGIEKKFEKRVDLRGTITTFRLQLS